MDNFTYRKNGVIACGFKSRQQKNKYIFTVIDGFTFEPIGVFDDFDKAKLSGERITNNKFIIIRFNLNDDCKYNFDNVYQSPGLL
jgi:hypothetical protein